MSEQARATQWIRSPAWDGLWLFSGLWAPALAILAYLALTLGGAMPVAVDAPGRDVRSFALLYLPLSILHRISTTYSVLGTPLLRDDIRGRPGRYLYVPLAIVVGCVALGLAFAFHSSFSFMPSLHAQLWAFFALAYVMILWERWHFCAQEFGVLSLYRIRAGQHAPADKRFDRLYTVVLMLGVNMVLFVCLGFSDERQVLLYGTPLAGYDGELLSPIAALAFTIGMIALGVALLRELRHPRRSLPKMAFYFLVGAHTLLLYAFPRAMGLFFLSYVFHHWMVAVGLFGRVTLGSYASSTSSQVHALWRLVLRVGPWLLAAILWYYVFGVLDKAGKPAPVPDARMFEGASVSAKLLAGSVVGLFFALNYLHYYYDRCFYSFTNPAVRKNVAPLLFGPTAAERTPAVAPASGAVQSAG